MRWRISTYKKNCLFINVRIYSIPLLLAAIPEHDFRLFFPHLFSLYFHSFLFLRKKLVKEIQEVIKIPHPSHNIQIYSSKLANVFASRQEDCFKWKKISNGETRNIFVSVRVSVDRNASLVFKVYVKMFARFYLSLLLFPSPSK